MEVEDAPVERCLMLAQRVARLMRDQDAQTWLDYEQRGYPASVDNLGSCSEYAYRFGEGNTVVLRTSLPQLEAQKHAAKAVLDKVQAPTVTAPVENYLEAGATQQVMTSMTKVLAAARDAYVNSSNTYSTMRGCLHRWATDTLIALELGSAAEEIFDAARSETDTFIRSFAPKAAEQLLAVNERMKERKPEALSQALTSCRRLLTTIADVVFPARSEPWLDGSGRPRPVGQEQYVNRLLAFLERSISSKGTRAINLAQINDLSARLDALSDKASKGVHVEVSDGEARLLVIQTYLFIAEVARYAEHVTQPGPSAE
jgi:hypothetical protein